MGSFLRISTCLHFRGNAEEAVTFYTSVFPDSRILSVERHGENAPRPAGEPMMLSFELGGTRFDAVNGTVDWPFTAAMSLMVWCEDQAELDRCRDAMLAGGGEILARGWLRDRFGVCWQILPARRMAPRTRVRWDDRWTPARILLLVIAVYLILAGFK